MNINLPYKNIYYKSFFWDIQYKIIIMGQGKYNPQASVPHYFLTNWR